MAGLAREAGIAHTGAFGIAHTVEIAVAGAPLFVALVAAPALVTNALSAVAHAVSNAGLGTRQGNIAAGPAPGAVAATDRAITGAVAGALIWTFGVLALQPEVAFVAGAHAWGDAGAVAGGFAAALGAQCCLASRTKEAWLTRTLRLGARKGGIGLSDDASSHARAVEWALDRLDSTVATAIRRIALAAGALADAVLAAVVRAQLTLAVVTTIPLVAPALVVEAGTVTRARIITHAVLACRAGPALSTLTHSVDTVA